jgi:hypothetical protein
MAEKKQLKVFDPGKPHATVYGHPGAKFEQNGILYAGNGEPMDAAQLARAEEMMAEENHDAEVARKKELAAK